MTQNNIKKTNLNVRDNSDWNNQNKVDFNQPAFLNFIIPTKCINFITG